MAEFHCSGCKDHTKCISPQSLFSGIPPSRTTQNRFGKLYPTDSESRRAAARICKTLFRGTTGIIAANRKADSVSIQIAVFDDIVFFCVPLPDERVSFAFCIRTYIFFDRQIGRTLQITQVLRRHLLHMQVSADCRNPVRLKDRISCFRQFGKAVFDAAR